MYGCAFSNGMYIATTEAEVRIRLVYLSVNYVGLNIFLNIVWQRIFIVTSGYFLFL